jgi:hypothetical protein
MEKDNLRNRRRHSFEFVRTRLLLLDFILANQGLAYFESEQDKVRFFSETMSISKELLPAKVYEGRPGSQPTVRYFVDKFDSVNLIWPLLILSFGPTSDESAPAPRSERSPASPEG